MPALQYNSFLLTGNTVPSTQIETFQMKNGETYIGQGDLTDKTNVVAHGFGMTSRTDSSSIVTTYMG